VDDLKNHTNYGGNHHKWRFLCASNDDYARYAYVHLMETKDEAFDKFKIYKAEVETQLGVKVKVLHLDHGVNIS